ncbi:cobalamin B12-binding domain-containing protein [bacterium]|nr:cobalamin B12-binding domain-containing protein [bacterium]
MKKVLAGAIGNCIHIAGTVKFLRLAEELGYETIFLGPAVPIEEFIRAIEEHNPDIVGVSYRLTPEVAEKLLLEFKNLVEERGLKENRLFLFGGTPPVCQVAIKLGLFARTFNGLEPQEELIAFLTGKPGEEKGEDYGNTLLERLRKKHPYPLLRHHLGLPSLEETIESARRVALAKVLDVISIAPDQNAQEHFFRPEEMDPSLSGAGGVPIRKPEDLKAIYAATRCGNFPLLRIYAGTRDLIKWAEMAQETIKNAWAAIPLFWYSRLDGRSKRPLIEAIRENQEAIRWHAERGIPVEINDPHQWGLRDAHDALEVADAYLCAYNAKHLGVSHYVAQYMLNTPPHIFGSMDLAKTLAKIELVESLQDENFTTFRQVRTGLLSLSPDPDIAKGQLASSITLSLALRPHIIHIVGYCEGDHAAGAEEIIESCKIARGVIDNYLFGLPNMAKDPVVDERKRKLIQEAKLLIEMIKLLGGGKEEALTDPEVLAKAVKLGILDAPHLRGNPEALGIVDTRVIGGAVYAIDPKTKRPLSERERLLMLIEQSILPSDIAKRAEKLLKAFPIEELSPSFKEKKDVIT